VERLEEEDRALDVETAVPGADETDETERLWLAMGLLEGREAETEAGARETELEAGVEAELEGAPWVCAGTEADKRDAEVGMADICDHRPAWTEVCKSSAIFPRNRRGGAHWRGREWKGAKDAQRLGSVETTRWMSASRSACPRGRKHFSTIFYNILISNQLPDDRR